MTEDQVETGRPARRARVLTVVAALVAAGVGGALYGAASQEDAPSVSGLVTEVEPAQLGARFSPDQSDTLDLVTNGQVVGSITWPATEDCDETLVLPMVSDARTVVGDVEVCAG